MARKSKVFFVFVSVMVMFTTFAEVANATGATPSIFATRKACDSAVNAGEGAYKFYTPRYFSRHKKNPVDNIHSVVAPLEGVGCVEMDTTAGRRFVPQAEGTEFRFKKNADGTLNDTPYARHDCGNRVYSISYPTPKLPEPEPEVEKKVEVQVPPSPPAPVYRVGDPCVATDSNGKSFSGFVETVNPDGSASCAAKVEVSTPGTGTAIAQYVLCPLAGGLVGYSRSGATGAVTGGAAGAGGTYFGRRFGGENWGWTGCILGPIAGLIKWGEGGSPRGGAPVNPPLSGGAVNPPLW